MINSYNQFAKAVSALYPTVTNLHGEIAYDDNGNEVAYNKAAVEAKITEITAQELAIAQTAKNKLLALGLTEAEINSLIK